MAHQFRSEFQTNMQKERNITTEQSLQEIANFAAGNTTRVVNVQVHCGGCGTVAGKGVKFCAECGTKIENNSATTTTTTKSSGPGHINTINAGKVDVGHMSNAIRTFEKKDAAQDYIRAKQAQKRSAKPMIDLTK